MSSHRPGRAAIRSGLLALLLVWLGIVPAGIQTLLADTLTGEIRGVIHDVEGRVPLPGVTVTLTNVDRGWQRQVETDAGGNYLFIQLEPGNYTVVARLDGYYETRRTDVLIRLNQPKVVVPPFELRRLVPTPTQQLTLRGEQTKTAIIDLTAPGPSPVVLAVVDEPGSTSLTSPHDGSLRFNFEASLVHSLPLRGIRTFDQLALLAPGVFRVPYSGGRGPAVGLGVGSPGQFSVNGMRGRSNNFTVDGSDNNDEDIGMRRQGFVSLVAQSIESIQEFQIMTAAFPAEFGRNTGSMVNAVSRAGGSGLHGQLYGLFQHEALVQSGPFETNFADNINGGSLSGGRYSGQDSRQAQWGGVLGGEWSRDRLFYLVSAERQDFRERSLGHFVVPAPPERALRVRDGLVPIEELGDFFEARAIPYASSAGEGIFSLYPLPNNPAGPFGENTYSQVRPAEGAGTVLSGRLDWYPAFRHSFTARYNLTQDHSLIPFSGEAINSSVATDTRTQNLSLFANSTGEQFGNVVRASYGRTRLAFPPEEGSPLLFGSVPPPGFPKELARTIETPYGRFGPFGVTGPVGQLSILPYSTIGIDVFNFPQGRVDNTFQFSDFFTRTGRRHTIKAGVDFRYSQLNSFSDRNARPLLLFGYGLVSSNCLDNPLCPFATGDGLLYGTDLAALGAPAGFLQTISTGPVADSTIGLNFSQIDLFVQDQWSVFPNFTINLGVRYELQSVPSETHDRIEKTFHLSPEQFSRLEPTGTPSSIAVIEAGNRAFDEALGAWQRFLAGRSKIYSRDRNNLAPRAAFAWDPAGNGRTVLRGGAAISFDANLGAVTSNSRNVFPTFVPVNLDPNFRPPTGQFINSPAFFIFSPTGEPLIRPGSLNSFNLGGEAFATALGALFVQAPPFPGGSLSSNGLAFTLPERDLATASAGSYFLSLQRQLGEDYLVSLSYVGTRGLHLTRFSTPNGGLVSTPVLLSPAPGRPLGVFDLPPEVIPGQNRRPETALGAYRVFENSGRSHYHSWQGAVEKRFSRGIQFRFHWTWSHAIDDVSDPFDVRGSFSLPQDLRRLDLESASASFDVRHRVAGFLTWDLPRGSGHWLLRDWKLAALAEFNTGQPFTVNTAIDRNFDGNLTDRLDSVQGIVLNPGGRQPLSLSANTSPAELLAARGQAGRVARNSFRAAGFSVIDLALSRRMVLSEQITLDIRTEVFNLLNATSFGIPVRILESPAFGRTVDTQSNPRSLRLMVRLEF